VVVVGVGVVVGVVVVVGVGVVKLRPSRDHVICISCRHAWTNHLTEKCKVCREKICRCGKKFYKIGNFCNKCTRFGFINEEDRRCRKKK
jgi:hypothetical protein